MLASEVMDKAAALLNDQAKILFTYAVQVPYLNMAIDELQETLEQYNIPVTNAVSAVLPLLAGATDISVLPADLIEIQSVFEADPGSQDYYSMQKVDFLPEGQRAGAFLGYWAYFGQKIHFVGASGNRSIKINYIAKAQAPVLDGNTTISIVNAASFLEYRTGALCAEFISENPSRANALNQYAVIALDRMLATNVKSSQSIPVRRRPFMASYKGGW